DPDRVGRSLYPGDDGVRWPSPYPWPPPAALHRPVPIHPRTATQPGMWTCRGISESFLVVAPCRPFPSPVAAMVGSATLGLFPRAPYPTDQEPATHVAVGTGRTQTCSYVFDIRRTSSTSSLITCDRASQRGRSLPRLNGIQSDARMSKV